MPPKKSSKRKRGSNNDDEVVDINDENKTISKKTTKKSKARETSLSTDLINPSKEDVSVDNTDYPFGKVERFFYIISLLFFHLYNFKVLILKLFHGI